MRCIASLIVVAALCGGVSADTIEFSQDTFPTSESGMTADGWTFTANKGVSGKLDPDGQNNALPTGWSGNANFAQKSTGHTLLAGTTYYLEADFRLTKTWSNETWTGASDDDRPVSLILRVGTTDVTSPSFTISAADSATQWTPVRYEISPATLSTYVGSVPSVRLWKGDFGGAQEIIWADNIAFGIVPEPGTVGLLALGAVALAARRRKR